MKKLQLTCVSLIVLLFVSCETSKGVSTAEDIGTYAFDILKDFDNMTKNSYVNTILTLEEVKDFVKQNAETLDERTIKNIERQKSIEYKDRMGRDYNRIKERAHKADLTFADIQYTDYTFEEEDEGGIKVCMGKLAFTHNDNPYTVRITAVLLGNRYRLARMRSLRKVEE